MASYVESDRLFHFDEQWTILKYDDHHYYQTVSGRSFSGIDFAGILNQEELYLIEIKNFFQHDNEGIINDVDQFALEIKEKILDSIDLIQIIYKYHQRSWMYRCFNQIIMRFPVLHQTWWFWTRMKELIDQKSFTFVLLIESVEDTKFLLDAIQKKLNKENYVIPDIQLLSLDSEMVPGLEITIQD